MITPIVGYVMLGAMQEQLFDLNGKTALVTGASGGLGYRFAEVLAEAGAQIIVTSRNGEHPALLELQKRYPNHCLAQALDVADPQSIDALFQKLAEQALIADVLVNNAGVAAGDLARDVSTDTFDTIMRTNFRGPWLIAQGFANALIAANQTGSLINIASILASRVASATAPYASSKAALLHMTKSLALEWSRYGIRVNAISPGYIETSMTSEFFKTEAGLRTIKRIPQNRIGQPSDLDGVLLLLASDASSYMTGSEMVVDGGHLCSAL